jgi:hypothetical protein
MLPTIPSALIIPASEMAQRMQEELRESRTRARQRCDKATAVCATAAVIRHETARLRHHAQQLRVEHAKHVAAGVRRRHNGCAR